jgi:K+-sensing histidine kinase KdpD
MAALLANRPQRQADVVTDVARQLKAPVATLRAQAIRLELRAGGHTEADATREVASHIVQQADRVSEWVAAILDVQRIRLGKLPLEPGPVDLVDLAATCIDTVQQSVDGPAITLVAHEPRQVVNADSARLSRVLVSILHYVADNATSSAIEVRLERSLWAGTPCAVVSVGDHTCVSGDASAALDLDLDLYVARELCRLHDGELWVTTSESGCPGLICLALPLDFSPGSHAVLAPATASSPTAA